VTEDLHGFSKRRSCSSENEVDEYLEKLMLEAEKENRELKGDQVVSLPDEKLLEKGIELGYFSRRGNEALLTEEGVERSRQLIRSHRLAERLLADILNFSDEEIEEDACRYEHLLDESAIDSICSLLGHPRTCPHGNPIPPGKCCQGGAFKFRPLVVPLTELEPGEEAEVKYLATTDNDRLAHLTSLGITPGQQITLLRRRPAYVVQVDTSVISFDDEIAGQVYVRPVKQAVAVKKGRRFRWSRKFLRGR